jgi:hypothetical protein
MQNQNPNQSPAGPQNQNPNQSPAGPQNTSDFPQDPQ